MSVEYEKSSAFISEFGKDMVEYFCNVLEPLQLESVLNKPHLIMTPEVKLCFRVEKGDLSIELVLPLIIYDPYQLEEDTISYLCSIGISHEKAVSRMRKAGLIRED